MREKKNKREERKGKMKRDLQKEMGTCIYSIFKDLTNTSSFKKMEYIYIYIYISDSAEEVARLSV